mmetsp:Transcript_42295/g.30500  ORF Transcript_42295/g.30500 Transcript_42295/m.30500 type:complete len:92 (+) Transcript_42295:219-494(+)|eukprot:CAMPEP_0116878432 /NCGR_PEP_ID=MMETSP0463-20121206/10190_1 /TAXON_ID=181622 /ORGANISM="Strombidinopsis sp, Strain SopsisLIS2011" /LENGTH=91 /DNA_ID=CAMNT_0004526663 /DNA_START=161 /DNA_END=436 /DNA_ORIENTATION=-
MGIVDMKFKNDYNLMLDKEGKMYSCGKSREGVLGLGVLNRSTKQKAFKIEFPPDKDEPFGERIIDFQVGNSHVLALSQSGKVFSWGSNFYG